MTIQPKKITIMYLQVVVMPNGEILCDGKTLGWFDKLKQFLRD